MEPPDLRRSPTRHLPPVGTYHARRIPDGTWKKVQLSPLGIAGFHTVENTLLAISQVYGKLQTQTWDVKASQWSPAKPVIGAESYPTTAGFVDILRPESGSTLAQSPILVTDSPIPDTTDRLLWFLGLDQLPVTP